MSGENERKRRVEYAGSKSVLSCHWKHHFVDSNGVSWFSECEGQRVDIMVFAKMKKKAVFIIRLCLPFVLFSRRVIPHTVSLLRGCYAAVTSPPFLFLPRLTCHTGLFLNNTKLNEAVEIHAASLPSAGTFFFQRHTHSLCLIMVVSVGEK